MTVRGGALAVFGLLCAVAGWYAGWPEFTAVGAGAIALVVAARLLVGWSPRVTVSLNQTSIQVVRGQVADVRIEIDSRSRLRWLRLVEGSVREPGLTVTLPSGRNRAPLVIKAPVDTSRRGERPLGPYRIVHGDPWSVVSKIVGEAPAGTLLVRPRVHPVRTGLSPQLQPGDSDVATRRRGEDHFHALREYVLGDEPRTVHWRSSARAGRLVVRQQVSAAADGTVVVLDTDSTAFGTDDQFGSGFVQERFEHAVEVAASLAVQRAGGSERVHFLNTARCGQAISASAASLGPLIDALALVEAVAPVRTAADELPATVRRLRCTRLIVITGTPGQSLIRAVRACSRGIPSTLVVRVGASSRPSLPGLRVLDVTDAEALS